ncbi:MAG: tRNA (cytidine(34)-2'-O)-methyltransferase [Pseudomonadota bacterium]
MFHVVLFEPEIPPNTGNIIRLCANTGCALHLIEPLGFSLEEKRLRRAGLDYREIAEISVHQDLQDCLEQVGPANVWALSSKVQRRYTDAEFEPGDVLLFGPESRGLPDAIKTQFAETALTLPMAPESRSLNLANSVAVVVYEAWRQQAFDGAPE